MSLAGRDVTRSRFFVLDARSGELSVGSTFPPNPSTGASQDASRVGSGASNFYLYDEYLLDIRVNDSAGAGGVAAGAAFAREAPKSSSRKFFVRVEYGAGGAIGSAQEDTTGVTGGPIDALARLLTSHGLQVRFALIYDLAFHLRLSFTVLYTYSTCTSTV